MGRPSKKTVKTTMSNGEMVIVTRLGDDDFELWVCFDETDELDGGSVRGTLADIIEEIKDCSTNEAYATLTKEQADLLIKTIRGWE